MRQDHRSDWLWAGRQTSNERGSTIPHTFVSYRVDGVGATAGGHLAGRSTHRDPHWAAVTVWDGVEPQHEEVDGGAESVWRAQCHAGTRCLISGAVSAGRLWRVGVDSRHT